MKALVDTDILSELQRTKSRGVRARAAEYERKHGPPAISVLTIFEGLLGWYQRGRPDLASNFLAWVAGYEIVAFDLGCARLAGEIGGALVRAGRPIGVVDVGLAATAIHHGWTLVSGNTTHFNFVRDAGFRLELENWRDPPP